MLHALAALPLLLSQPSLPAAPTQDGGPNWFAGTFEEALAAARREEKLVFVDFWATWCKWCRALETNTLAKPEVMERLELFICCRVDADSEAGVALSRRFAVTSLPALLFVQADGTPRDLLLGYVEPRGLLSEIERIRRDERTLTGCARAVQENGNDVFARLDYLRLLARFQRTAEYEAQLHVVLGMLASESGFVPDDLEQRYAIATTLSEFGRAGEAEAQFAAIRRLDPEQRSLAAQKLALDEAVIALRKRIDVEPLRAIVARPWPSTILGEAWRRIAEYESYMVTRDRARAAEHRTAQRLALRRAFEHVSPADLASFGGELALAYYEQRAALSEDERRFAADVAARASAAAPHDLDLLDTLASCLELVGDIAGALAALDRGLALRPDSVPLAVHRSRLAKLAR